MPQISSLKLMQTGGDSLLPDQKVKIARDDATLQKLRTLEQQYPDEAAAFAVLMSKPGLRLGCQTDIPRSTREHRF